MKNVSFELSSAILINTVRIETCMYALYVRTYSMFNHRASLESDTLRLPDSM